MENYEFFKSNFEFRGKHAKMIDEIWVQNEMENSFFRRLIDLYTMAAIIGFKMNRKAKVDYVSEGSRKVFPEQMLNQKEELDFIMQMMIMLEYKDTLGEQESIKKAFRGPETKEEYKEYNDLFTQYVLGGVEVLYEKLVIPKLDTESEYKYEKVENVMQMLKRL